jgi:hypothetical protein
MLADLNDTECPGGPRRHPAPGQWAVTSRPAKLSRNCSTPRSSFVTVSASRPCDRAIFRPSKVAERFHDLGFIDRKENVILLGPSGGRENASCQQSGIAAAEHGRRVYHGTLADLITSLEEARTGSSSSRASTS